jgi:hypothetical protein
MLNNLTLEELIALKLEVSLRSVGYGLYGLPLKMQIKNIATEAVVTACLSLTENRYEAAALCGMARKTFDKFTWKIDAKDWFEDGIEEEADHPPSQPTDNSFEEDLDMDLFIEEDEEDDEAFFDVDDFL